MKLAPMIDEPGVFDTTLETWERYLKTLEDLPESTLKPAMIASAKKTIAWKRARQTANRGAGKS